MKLLIIRHADPDYENDSLTEKGRKEAELLSNRISAMDVKEFYVSPLGRARETADFTLNKMNRTAEVLPWLREFDARIYDEELGKERICWDLLPQIGQQIMSIISKDLWHTVPDYGKGQCDIGGKKVLKELIRL